MIKDTNFLDMALIDRVRVIKLLLFALFVMVRTVAPAQNQVDWSIKAGIGMANIIGVKNALFTFKYRRKLLNGVFAN